MPCLDGPATLNLICNEEESKQMPLISLKAKLQKLGAVGVSLKPFAPITLADDIFSLCAKEG